MMNLRQLFLAAAFCIALPAFAQAEVISAINIEGSQRVDVDSVKSYLTFKEGDEYADADINASVKALFATNLFSDVKIYKQGSAISIKLVENPIVSRVAFEGNKTIKNEKLEPEVSMKSRSVYTKSAVQNDVQRIADLYRKNGRYNATVEPKVILKDQNRVDLVYEINEGQTTVIKKIVFVGNRAFSDKALSGVVMSSETRWYNFFSDNDKYDSDRLEFDKELLRRFYTKNGYADFRITSAVAELSPDRDSFILNFSVDEGSKYKFGKIDIVTQLQDMQPEQLKGDSDEIIRTVEGKSYDSTKVEKTVDNLVEKAGERGFAFVDVSPQLDRNKETKIININYTIKEGPKVYVDKININGNSRTLDKVIRREFRLAEGDPFNTSAIKRSKQRIENLGYFKSVDIKQEKAGDLDKVNIEANVDEKSTGELNFGAGFSTVDGVLGEVSLAERNFLGRGQKVRVNVSASTRRQEGQLSFTEPYFWGKDLEAGFDIFSIKRDQETESSYKSESLGLNLRAGYDITEELRHNMNYRVSADEITDVNSNASLFIKQQEGDTLTSLIGHDLIYDMRDSKIDPSSGYFIKAGQDLAGLGGDVKFLRHELNAGYYVPIDDDREYRLSFLGNAGTMFGIGEDVPINQRFFVGGQNFRGFERGGIGPRDIATTDSLGGNNYFTTTAELGFPLGLPEDLGFRGALFMDAGSLWGLDSSGPGVYDEADLRATVGAGIAWSSPFGPIRVDFAVPLTKNDNDRTESFQLNFGTRF